MLLKCRECHSIIGNKNLPIYCICTTLKTINWNFPSVENVCAFPRKLAVAKGGYTIHKPPSNIFTLNLPMFAKIEILSVAFDII